MRILFLILLIPFLGVSQNYKLVNNDYPEIIMKKIENDTVSAKLITSKSIIDGYVVYRQIKRLDIDHVYRFPESFLGIEKKPEKNVLYYEAEKVYEIGTWSLSEPHYIINDNWETTTTDFLEMPSNIKIKY